MLQGFIDDNHRASFLHSGRTTRFGSPGKSACGARTRKGERCQAAPLTGHNRCLKHAGPKAAKAHREAQLRDLAAGRLDPAVFARAEEKRARNRLHDLWKKHGPWFPGSTIDLGPHEAQFATALDIAGWCVSRLPPGIADRLRWKFRRTVLDRSRPAIWAEVVHELPSLIAAAGDAPDEYIGPSMPGPAAVAPDRLPLHSRRRRADDAMISGKTRTARQRSPPLPHLSPEDAAEMLFRNRADLAPVLSCCENEDQRSAVAAAYKLMLDRPDELKSRRTWSEIVQKIVKM